ncbi:MAG TPA: hypothetical protein VIY53_02050 [Acidobacteriaceae bacterium]
MRVLSIGLMVLLSIAAFVGWRILSARMYMGPPVSYRATWSPSAAAQFLDQREAWWQSWPPAHEDHSTLCISCHTVVPYALARPELRQQPGEPRATAEEQVMLASVEKRVTDWPSMIPFYSDAKDGPGKTAQSHATEAVLNAIILASYDANHGHLRPVTRRAFDEVWALQLPSGQNAGGWPWQDFHLAPWESADSGYSGAAMLAIALEHAPDDYAADPAVAPHVQRLAVYLQRLYPTQPLMSQLYVLWASASIPDLLTEPQRTSLLQRIKDLQQPDGGWTLFSLDREDSWAALASSTQSDGCATGLVALALEQSGTDPHAAILQRGLNWLAHHQTTDGSWRAISLNKRRNLRTDIGLFMTDAATGYAVMALEQPKPPATNTADARSH